MSKVSFAKNIIIHEIIPLTMIQIRGDWRATIQNNPTNDPDYGILAQMRIQQERLIFMAWKKVIKFS